jgi:hypothetical protein
MDGRNDTPVDWPARIDGSRHHPDLPRTWRAVTSLRKRPFENWGCWDGRLFERFGVSSMDVKELLVGAWLSKPTLSRSSGGIVACLRLPVMSDLPASGWRDRVWGVSIHDF